MRLVLWCDGSAIVISAGATMMHCVSEGGLEMLLRQQDFATSCQTGGKIERERGCGQSESVRLKRSHLDENWGIFAFNISRATTLISINQMGQSRT